MDLIIKKPLNWSMAVTAPEGSGVKDQQAMRDAVAKIAKDVNVPLLYVPYGRTGFLLAMEEGVEREAKAARKSRTAALGFEEADGGVRGMVVHLRVSEVASKGVHDNAMMPQ